MMQVLDDPIRQVRLSIARITDKTLWSFVEIRCASGAEGVGEASLAGRERALLDAAVENLPRWLAGEPLPGLDTPPPLPVAALRTALDVARCDAAARAEGVGLARRLGGDAAAQIPLYANINRRTRDRSPAGFGASAAHAIARGFQAVKIAPFDEVGPALRDDAEGRKALDAGIARIAAVREALGPDRRLMVDCHWRFGAALSARLVEAIRPFGLYWLECPVVEEPRQIPALAAMRKTLNARDTLLAGLEEFTGAPAFLAYADAYDVMMPDMKYVGGVDEMLRTAERLAERGIAVSPHNPTGPICHAASLQLCAALPGFSMLEMQLDETPLFWSLAQPGLPPVDGGSSALPAGAGLGVTLDQQAIGELSTVDLRFSA